MNRRFPFAERPGAVATAPRRYRKSHNSGADPREDIARLFNAGTNTFCGMTSEPSSDGGRVPRDFERHDFLERSLDSDFRGIGKELVI